MFTCYIDQSVNRRSARSLEVLDHPDFCGELDHGRHVHRRCRRHPLSVVVGVCGGGGQEGGDRNRSGETESLHAPPVVCQVSFIKCIAIARRQEHLPDPDIGVLGPAKLEAEAS